jgi:hypothetical protein
LATASSTPPSCAFRITDRLHHIYYPFENGNWAVSERKPATMSNSIENLKIKITEMRAEIAKLESFPKEPEPILGDLNPVVYFEVTIREVHYSYTAILANGLWYPSLRPHSSRSTPMSWELLCEFADVNTILIATEWEKAE